MEGSVPRLPDIIALKKKYKVITVLCIDERSCCKQLPLSMVAAPGLHIQYMYVHTYMYVVCTNFVTHVYTCIRMQNCAPSVPLSIKI